MSSLKFLTAGAFAALSLAAAVPASAADLYGDPPPRRYSGYEEYYAAPPVREEYVERYSRRDYPAPMPPARVYGGSIKDGPALYEPAPPPRRYSCVPREMIRDRLVGEGWRDFSNPEIRDGFAILRARRPSGRPFELRIDRCDGHVVEARPLRDGHYGPYAWGPRRYPGRPYYPYY